MNEIVGDKKKKWNKESVICIHINHQICWICEGKAETHHHAIPKRLKPINNVHIPLCNYCHKEIHKIQ